MRFEHDQRIPSHAALHIPGCPCTACMQRPAQALCLAASASSCKERLNFNNRYMALIKESCSCNPLCLLPQNQIKLLIKLIEKKNKATILLKYLPLAIHTDLTLNQNPKYGGNLNLDLVFETSAIPLKMGQTPNNPEFCGNKGPSGSFPGHEMRVGRSWEITLVFYHLIFLSTNT